jgi:hypothetical protein
MLTYLDDLPAHNAVIGTSNLSLETLTERFQTRFQLIHLHGPSDDELARWLVKRWKVPKQTAEFMPSAPAETFGKRCSPRAGSRCSAKSSIGRERPRLLKTPRR